MGGADGRRAWARPLGLERQRRAVRCAARQLPAQRGECRGAEGDRKGARDGAAADAPQQQRLGAVGSAQQPPRTQHREFLGKRNLRTCGLSNTLYMLGTP